METYCRNETDVIALSTVSDLVGNYDIGEIHACSGTDGLSLLLDFVYLGLAQGNFVGVFT